MKILEVMALLIVLGIFCPMLFVPVLLLVLIIPVAQAAFKSFDNFINQIKNVFRGAIK